MKITFLGTSHGVPAADRFCTCMMLEVGGKVYFIDAGAPLLENMMIRNLQITSFKAFFNTHAHADHIGYLFSSMSLCDWYFKETAVTYVLTEQRVFDALNEMLCATDGQPLDTSRHTVIIAKEGKVYEDENIKVSYYPTTHLQWCNRPAYSILVETEGKKVFFSGDLKPHLETGAFPQYVKENEVDLFVCELAHFSLEAVMPELQKTKTKALCFNHVYPLDKYEQIAKIHDKLPFPIIAPSDGDVVEI